MRLKSLLIALLIVSLVEAPGFASPSPALGVIMQADHARVSAGDAVSGATVFDGDLLVTDVAGTLRARLGEAQLRLPANSLVAVRQPAGGVSARLQRGAAVFSTASAQAFELLASDAHMRARNAQPTYAQVVLVGPYELVISCQRGELEVTIGDEVHVVSDNASYEVTLEPPGPQGTGGPPVKPGRSTWNRVALILIFGAIATGTVLGVRQALVSPSGP
jgi:hypothetical protein